MGRQVEIEVRAGETVKFPAECLYCNSKATERLRLHKRSGRITRLVDAPLCSECAVEVHRLSGEEERWHKLSRVLAILTLLLTLPPFLLLTPVELGFPILLMLALLPALGAAAIVFHFARQVAQGHALPRKREILEAARLWGFSWRTVTFEFENDQFARRFAALNERRPGTENQP